MEILGAQIREKRKTLGLTLKELSRRLKISPSTLHKIETGTLSPTVALMVEICHQLDTPVYNLIKEKRKVLMHLKKSEQKQIGSHNIVVNLIADFGLINENVTVSVLEVKEGAVLLKHCEPFQVFVYVVKGKVSLEFDGTIFEGSAGEALYFDGSYPHSARALTDAQLINIYIRDDG